MSVSELADLRLTSLPDAMALLAGLWRTGLELPVLFVVLDHERAIVDIYPLSGVEESQVPELLEPLLVRHADDGQWVLVVTDRTSEVPVVRADDELTWQEWSDLVAARGLELLDWFVRVDCYAFSVAEFAPTPSHW